MGNFRENAVILQSDNKIVEYETLDSCVYAAAPAGHCLCMLAYFPNRPAEPCGQTGLCRSVRSGTGDDDIVVCVRYRCPAVQCCSDDVSGRSIVDLLAALCRADFPGTGPGPAVQGGSQCVSDRQLVGHADRAGCDAGDIYLWQHTLL